MKRKRDLALDFTSLLDVIMILLFVVICNMSQAAIEANENAEAANKELEGAKEQLEDNQAKIDELSSSNQSLNDELAQFTINGEQTSQNMSDAYGSAIDNTTKVLLKCSTGMDIDTNNHKVSVEVVIKNQNNNATKTELKIIHDFSLSYDDRVDFNNKQVSDMTAELKNALGTVNSPLVWFMIEYEYADENFSNSDLEMIKDSIKDLQLETGINYQVEEIRE